MPFWWRRRRRPWFGRWRRKRTRRYKTRRFARRRYRRPAGRRRRRRRRRHKVRRKKKRIPIMQWQPESIRKCKVKGFGCLVLGGEGRQYRCYTNEASKYTQAKAPGGGGFGVEVISLQYLYNEYKAHNCIWTTSNAYKDLIRYTGCSITLYRHPTVDFIFAYSLQTPFQINQFTYPDTHPQNLLLRKHHRVVLSKASNPNGKLKIRIKIKPPKLMTTKWFFQKEFSSAPLVLLQASAASFEYPRIGQVSPNNNLTLIYLNPEFWMQTDWAQYRLGPYMYLSTGSDIKVKYKQGNETKEMTLPPSKDHTDQAYWQSINYNTGWFNKIFLNARPEDIFSPANSTNHIAHLPLAAARYNPHEDTGKGNEVWLCSVTNGHFNKPSVTPDYLIQGLPLWMSFYGFWNYIEYVTKDPGVFKSHMFVVKSPSIYKLQTTVTKDYYPIVDSDFIYGKLPYDEYISEEAKKKWYPTAMNQMVTINNIVECGPYIPKLNNTKNSSWELSYRYSFYFKFGGPQQTDPPIDDPKTQGIWDVPSTLQKTIQIEDPKKQATESMLHDWDYRRGFITQRALKRMSENIQTDSDVESYDSEPTKKRKKVTKELPHLQEQEEKTKKCLLSLCESDTSQEEEQTLQQYIHKQHKQQHKLKKQLLHLFSELKHSQRQLQLQTGILE
nr:MAG: ORF1 [Torque teno midi virus]